MKHTKRTPIATFLTLLSSATLAFSGTYTVQSGDTLWRISLKHKVSVAEIQQVNNISGNSIRLGQVLTIPGKAVAKTPSDTAAPITITPKQKARSTTHVVRKGENLWRIAQNNNTTMKELIKRNNLSSSVISAGQVILISGSSQSTVKKTEKKQNEKLVVKELPRELSKKGVMLPLTPKVEESVKIEDVIKPVEKTTDAPDPLAPLPVLAATQAIIPKAVVLTETPVVLEPLKPKGLDALSEKQRSIVSQQVLLDRNGLGPGVIDGYEGDFSKTATVLAKNHRSDTAQEETLILVETTIPAAVLHFINPDLPGTGKRPDFKQATEDQCLMMYKTAIELLAERYHCSEKLLAKMNPQIDFAKLSVGEKIMVPNVTEFKIEDFMDSAGKAITYKYLRGSRRATSVDVNYLKNRVMVWYNNGAEGANNELLASFPVTTNIKKGPKSQRTIAYFAPAPSYMRKKTGLKLKPGPNSPVGIVWAKLGDGFGIHGTSDGSGNGYNTSSGCIRLSNWDMAIFVQIVPSKTKVNFITGEKITEKVEATPEPATDSVSVTKR